MSEPSRLVMVVDGDPAVRREVRTACEQDGYQVLDAETGADALRLHTSAHPILAVDDLAASLRDIEGNTQVVLVTVPRTRARVAYWV